MTRFNSILDCVGNTPAVRINNLGAGARARGVELYVKIESANPMASVKDRLALGVIEAAERDGSLKPGQTVIEATSGNTGIGLAMVCAQKGYPLVVVMAESFSVERRRLMRFLGAKVVLTPAAAKGSGMIAKAQELADKHGWFLARQFENEANPDMHSRTTAREIIADFDGRGPDFFVTGFGTGGTLKGIARVLRAECPDTQIIAAEPENSPLMGSGILQQYDVAGRPTGSHPAARPHPMQGWSPDFTPRMAHDVLQAGMIDRIIGVEGADALSCSRDLARREGIFCGITSGATFAAALAVAEAAPAGSRILAMLPDTGERYMSTVLFDGIEADMNAEEEAISTSTPMARFDTPPAAAPIKPPVIAADHPGARALARILLGTQQPITFFGLEWCEFCWSAKAMLDDCGLEYRMINFDAPGMDKEEAAQLKQAVFARCKVPTVPQIFVGERLVGGCSELFAAYADGSLQTLLAERDVVLGHNDNFDPAAYLPRWMQARA